MNRLGRLLVMLCVAWVAPRVRAEQAELPKLFLSCPQECFDAYLRQELSYFDFVRDPHLATYNVVVVRQPSGNGGERFSVTLARRSSPRTFEKRRALAFTAPPGAPAHVVRTQLLQLLLRTLHAELADTPHASAFELRLPGRKGATLSALDDPWNYWVVAPELNGWGEGGSGYYFVDLTGALTLRRITESSKFRLRGSYRRDLSGYRLEDGSRVRGDVHGWEARPIYAHSVREHTAMGGVATWRAREFENLAWHVHGGPIIEFNVFPYVENATRQLRVAHQAGAWANWYIEENRAGLMREVRPYHALSVITDVNQPWGSVQWIGQVNMFLDDPKLFRVSTGAVLSLRLFQGFAVTLEGEAAYVKDQISLRARPVTDLELLLWTAQQRTVYTFEVEFAFTYTFGSVHNTIVNPRFGRVDLDEE